jgi:hypothetical protein
MTNFLRCGIALALIAASPVLAKALTSVPRMLDPTKAYVLIEYKRTPNPYYGTPLAPRFLPQMAGIVLGRYDVALGDIRGLGKAASNPVPGKRGPSEPFQNQPLLKTETALVYLHELAPDTYVVQGWGNTSFSLGSYRFAAKPGVVTDLGVVSASPDWAPGEKPGPLTAGKLIGAALAGPFAKPPPVAPARATFRARTSSDTPPPAGLPDNQITPVSFETGATFGNYLGGLVNRIEGVNAAGDQHAQPPNR